ncbi:MAG: DUF4010 domain-containing protein [Promethearchaeota archaeon]
MLVQITTIEAQFYEFLLVIIISTFCGFLIGIERTRARKLFGARDHIAYAILSTVLIILYENFLIDLARIIIFLIFGAMIIFLSIGSVYRLFHTQEPGYTSTMSMLLAIVVGILSYYMPYLAIAISVVFLVILSTKKEFEKIRELKQIEWTGTVEFLAIVILLFILIPENIQIVGINIRAIIIIFITILAIKYFSYFLLKSSTRNNLYYISFLGGFAHSEATTVELAENGAPSSSIWLVIQTMLLRMLLIVAIGAFSLFYYALIPITITTIIGLFGAFLILRKKKVGLTLLKVKNPLSIKGALIFTGTYLLAILITLGLEAYATYLPPLTYYWYYIISFVIGFLSGGASSLFVVTTYSISLINVANALIMLSIGLSAAIINKIFYARKNLHESKNKRNFTVHLLIYQILTISILITFTIFTILIFNLSIY